ncbi:MAG: PD40 domain-containing protein [Acidobacteria bacterium]|nr:PD40 domain-containing protein [Acidobacteriota bacterium]
MRMLILILAAAAAIAAQNETDIALQRAIRKETIEGDLKGAIEEYRKISQSTDRGLAAKALIRMADCYRKLGDVEAEKIYERVVRDYADQKEAVAIARARVGVPASPGSGIRTRRVWTLPPMTENFGGVSSDGRYLPYVNWVQSGDLYMRDLVAGSDRRLTNTGTVRPGVKKSQEERAEEWAFSRDGKQLAYAWLRNEIYELRLIDLQGNGVPQPRQLVRSEDISWIGPYDWSPDGKTIAVGIERKDKSAQIGLVSVADGSLRILKTIVWRGAHAMFFSRDGQFLAYDLPSAETTEERDVFLLAVDGSREAILVKHPSQDALLGWSPDGSHLLFSSDRTGRPGLWALPVARGKAQGPPVLLRSDLSADKTMGITATGALRYSTSEVSLADIQSATFDLNKGEFLSTPIQAINTFVGSNVAPDWSPDGKTMSYASRRSSVGSHYFVLGFRSLESGHTREVLPSPNFQYLWSLRWQPDGTSLIASGRDHKGRNGVFRVNAKTGETSIVVEADGVNFAVVSSDGKMLYYSTKRSDNEVLVKRDLASGEETELLRQSKVLAINLSPDGRYIVTANRNALGMFLAMQLVPVTGGEPRVLLDPKHEAFGPLLVWAPDSRWFITRGMKRTSDGKAELWRVPIDGGQPVKLAGSVDFMAQGTFALHPDGRQVLFQVKVERRPQEVWVLENFLPVLSESK